jgi:hypothetical protein
VVGKDPQAQGTVLGGERVDELFVLFGSDGSIGGRHVQQAVRLRQRPELLGLGEVDRQRRELEDAPMQLAVESARPARYTKRTGATGPPAVTPGRPARPTPTSCSGSIVRTLSRCARGKWLVKARRSISSGRVRHPVELRLTYARLAKKPL